MLTERSKPEDVPSQKEGTTQDKEDMWRVGRDQELNVRKLLRITQVTTKPNAATAKLPLPVCTWIYCSAYVHLGSCSLVSKR